MTKNWVYEHFVRIDWYFFFTIRIFGGSKIYDKFHVGVNNEGWVLRDILTYIGSVYKFINVQTYTYY